MKIFEDLIEELKEEHLLEETVTETHNFSNHARSNGSSAPTAHESNSPAMPEFPRNLFESQIEPSEIPNKLNEKSLAEDEETHFSEENLFDQGDDEQIYEQAENQPPNSEKEFYRKRAMEEVTGLQMVEHVLAGVEREQMKLIPKTYDDLPVKKALHAFMQVSEDVKSIEHAHAEFSLMQETETWCSALSHRDKRISAAHLRRFCETNRPPLSSQALISLARFYRNSPFSESVRNKFDLVITRLFSKDLGGEKRILVFTRDELIKHIKELYAEWSSIQLYSAEDDNAEIVLAAMKFEDFMAEAESANNFDELVKNDFFNRLRLFKEGTNELFYAPLITATAVECNIRVGNRYVDLIEAEREKAIFEQFQDKYGFLHDQAISDAASKTLQLVELLKERTETIETEYEVEKIPSEETSFGEYVNQFVSKESQRKKKSNKNKVVGSGFFAVNKYLLAATIAVVLLSCVLYFGVDFFAPDENTSANVKKVNLDNSSLQEYVHSARISTDTFYGITTPAWNGLTNEKKEENISKILSLGNEKGFTKVHLLDHAGKTVGTAVDGKVSLQTR